MKSLMWLVLLNSLFIECLCYSPPPVLLPSTPRAVSQYPFPSPALDYSKKYDVPNNLFPPVPIKYESPHQLTENPFINSNSLNVHDKRIIQLNEEKDRLKYLELFYNSLAQKFKNKLLRKISKTGYEQNPLNNHESDQTIPTNTQEEVNLVNGRRQFIDLNTYGINNPSKIYNLKLINQLTSKIGDNLGLGFLESGTLNNYNDVSLNGYYMETMDQNLPSLRYPSNFFGNTRIITVPKIYNSRIGWLLPSQYFYSQPIFNIKDPTKSFSNIIKYPYDRFLDFKTGLLDYGKPLYKKKNQQEVENIKSWITQVMAAHKHADPRILQIINDADEFDLTRLDNVYQPQLMKLSKTDLERLKTYYMLILNRYGITPYTYKLLEFINLLEGKPKQGSYLLYNILNNQRPVQSLNDNEINEIKRHLEQILKEYGTSPHILPFVQNIEGIHFVPDSNKKIYIYRFDTFDTPNYVSKEDMRRAHLYLLKVYASNPYIARTLQNLNEIYENPVANIALPVLDPKDLENLSYLNNKDLDLFVKYIAQIIKQRGENTYIVQLLAHLKQLQNKFDEGKHVKNITHEYDFVKRLNLSDVLEYLLHLNKTGVTNNDIMDILNRLNINNDIDISITKLNNTDVNEKELIKIREFLEQFYGEDKQNEKSFPPITVDDTIDIKYDDMKEILQYLFNQYNIIKSPYMIIILSLLRQTLNQPYENGFVRVRFHDFEQIYNYLKLTQDDSTNPVFIKIRHYVNEKNKNEDPINPDFYEKNDIINDRQINLYEIYNFLLHKSKSEKVDPALLEILQHFNTTLVLPNGEFKVRILNIDNTIPFDGINPNELQNLLLYIKKIQENKVLFNELLQHVKEKLNREHEQNILILSGAPRDSLHRIKNFLLTFIKEHGESEYILQILLEINRILAVPDDDHNYILILNGADSKINENDLDILTNYISAAKLPSLNIGAKEILNEINEYREKIKEKEKHDRRAQMKVFFLQIINDDQVSPVIKDIMKYFYLVIAADHLNSKDYTILNENEMKRLSALDSRDLDALLTYLKQFVYVFGPDPRVQRIFLYINKIKENIKKEDNKIIILNGTDVKEDEKGDHTIKITKDNLNLINQYILHLINLYGKDPIIMHVIQVIYNNKGVPGQESDLTNIITNNNVRYLKLDDVNNLKKYLLQLIQKHGANSLLMKTFRFFNKLHGSPVGDRTSKRDRPILHANDTHTAVVLKKDDINRIKMYLYNLTQNYGPNPFLLNILEIINAPDESPNENNVFNNSNSHVYTFTRLSYDDLNQLSQYILQLIEKLGASNELLDLLDLIYLIYGDSVLETNEKEQYVLEISKEIKNFKERGVTKVMQNMDKVKLISAYLQLLKNIFVGISPRVKVELHIILEKLLNFYKSEADPVKRYIILKLYEYLLINKGRGFADFWKPEFIDDLLELNGDGTDIYYNKIIVPSDNNYVIVEPYDYSKDIEKVLKLIVKSTIDKTWKPIPSDELNKKDILDIPIFDNNEKELNYKKVTCLTAYNKLEDIWRVLNGAITLKQVDSDFTMDDLNRMIDMFLIFKKKLSRELNIDSVPTKMLIDELEKILLSHHPGKCEERVDSTAFMTPIIESLREGILYMKSNHFTDDEIKRIVEATLVEEVLPELKSVTVQECIVRTKKELLNGLYNNIFKNDDDIEILGNKMDTKVTQDSQPTLAMS